MDVRCRSQAAFWNKQHVIQLCTITLASTQNNLNVNYNPIILAEEIIQQITDKKRIC